MHDAITRTQVILVGLGSLGSEIAHLLAQEGVRHFLLVDGDLMLPGNVARHRIGLVQVGQTKVQAVANLILQIQPEAKVDVVRGWFDDIASQIVGGNANVVFVGASGDEPTEHFIADVARDLSIPCIHAWLELDGQVLRTTRYLPDRDPTLSEISQSRRTPRLLASADPDGPRICADAVLPGSALNIHAAANFTVRLILDVITASGGDENHWLFAPGGVKSEQPYVELQRPYGVLADALLPS